MPSFSEQITAARAAHDVSSAIEDEARRMVAEIFDAWERGDFTPSSVRYALENVVRRAYRASIAVAAEHTRKQADIPGWKPRPRTNTPYLQNLLADVRRNLREFKSSDRDEKARRRAILRMQHSVGVAAQRGYSDALIDSYTELEDFGYRLRKLWAANFVNNVPCPTCRRLHGTEVDLHDDFPSRRDEVKVYEDLSGPPRHPRCRCVLVILIVRLENVFETPDLEEPTETEDEMDTDQVQALPWLVFAGILKALRLLIKFLTGV